MERIVADDLFTKPINGAHFHNRRAELLEERGDVSFAIEHHESAIKLLQMAIDTGIYDKQAKLSLRLQVSNHKSRVRLLQAQKENKVPC